MEALSEVPDWLITTVIGLLVAVVLWLNRYRFGLSELQLATKSERDKVIALQDRRIKLLEQEVKDLTRRVDYLTEENRSLHALLIKDE